MTHKTPDDPLSALFQAHCQDEELELSALPQMGEHVAAPRFATYIPFFLTLAAMVLVSVGVLMFKHWNQQTDVPVASDSRDDIGSVQTVSLRHVYTMPNGERVALVQTQGPETLRLVKAGDTVLNTQVVSVSEFDLHFALGFHPDAPRCDMYLYPKSQIAELADIGDLYIAWQTATLDQTMIDKLQELTAQVDPGALALLNDIRNRSGHNDIVRTATKLAGDDIQAQAFRNLLAIAADSSHPGRAHAVRALGRVPSIWSRRILRDIVADVGDSLRSEALQGLVQLQDTSACPLLRSMLDSSTIVDSWRNEVENALRYLESGDQR